uniref:Uncharacterized protein n=1 Tax=Octopus bimaculoides TaxID=37653 RepID=A0A0L8HFP1_OCTBM
MANNSVDTDNRRNYKNLTPSPLQEEYSKEISSLHYFFCLVLSPLTNISNRIGLGYKSYGRTSNHLLYMKDFTFNAADDKQLETLLQVVHRITIEIDMSFGLEKCTNHGERKINQEC